LRKIIGVVSHDAGGAEIVSRLVKKMEADYLFAIAGPAIEVFRRNLGIIENSTIEELTEKADYLICGTSWQSTHENLALKIAARNNVHVISVLDHYSFYLERYLKNGFDIVPKEIWVTDSRSSELAHQFFPMSQITIVGNPYLEDLKDLYREIEKPKLSSEYTDILYLTEPTSAQARIQSGHENAWGYTEFDALQYFLANLWCLQTNLTVRVYLRAHPSEAQYKYSQFLGTYEGYQVLMCEEKDLLISMAKVHAIVGCDTMALLLGVEIGVKVYSSLPPCAAHATIPTKGITYIRELNAHDQY
jgi:hypothetical protein